MRFQDIYGQEELKAHMQTAIQKNKVSHAYLITGERGMGKKMIADAFASAILCEKKTGEACEECRSCHQMQGHNHPDVIYVTHEKPNTISVQDIRDQVNGAVAIKPYQSEKKIIIMDEAEKMNEAAQNALLKTIEEPPEYCVIMLLSVNRESLLPTIRSRCVHMEMQPLRTEVMIKSLMEKMGLPDYEAEDCSRFAAGNLGKAIRFASSEDFNEMRERVLRIGRKLKDMELYEVTDEAVSSEIYSRDQAVEFYEMLSIWLRDVLLYKATGDEARLMFIREKTYIRRFAERSSYFGLEKAIEEVQKAKKMLRANVNYTTTTEILLNTIRES
ncbi:MAG: DNA polymerase III subunit delta' [Lachnospiraceae bacterium]|nr:DNA polymerase III subunit delta' [Lachnospiraceae bacterium]